MTRLFLKGLASEQYAEFPATITLKFAIISVWYEILRLFVNALTDDQYSGSNILEFTTASSKAIISKIKRLFLDFLLHFWNVHEI